MKKISRGGRDGTRRDGGGDADNNNDVVVVVVDDDDDSEKEHVPYDWCLFAFSTRSVASLLPRFSASISTFSPVLASACESKGGSGSFAFVGRKYAPYLRLLSNLYIRSAS